MYLYFFRWLTEAANQEGVAFGENSLVSTIADTLDSGDEIGAITNTVQAFQAGCEQLDDITLVELRC